MRRSPRVHTTPRRPRGLRLGALSLGLTLLLTSCPGPSTPLPPACPFSAADWSVIEAPGHSPARTWDELALGGIRNVLPQPTVHARTLFHLSAAMYDVWASYDGVARGVFTSEKHAGTTAEVGEAVQYAAHRVLRARFAPLAPGVALCFDEHLRRAGLNPDDRGVEGDTPGAVGRRIAQKILDAARNDGSNEAGGYADTSGYASPNEPLRPELPGATLADPDRWQRLLLAQPFTQNGIPQSGPQPFMGAHWGRVRPFAMVRRGPLYHDPGPAPSLGDPRMRDRWIPDLLRRQGELDARSDVTVDTSPGVMGDNPLGSDAGAGHPLNPVTGRAYAPNVVRRADFGRAMAEYWADGPRAETPPGHWNVIANAVTDDPAFGRRLGGSGPPLGPLEWDVKLYLALNGALHDAAISAWEIKRQTDTARPISLVRFLAAGGAGGLRPDPRVVEDRGGVTRVRGWHPFPGVDWGDPLMWVPYQNASFVSPAFPGFVSGHSTFSRAAAEVLTGLTGSPFFPGGLHEVILPPGFLGIGSPTNDREIRLQWATYFDAADQAGRSRIWGGIHLEPDDLAGRRIGHEIGVDAVALARRYFRGEAGAGGPK